MRKSLRVCTIAAAVLSLSSLAMAQEWELHGWELGGMGSYGFYKNGSVTSSEGSATAGISPGYGLGAVVGLDHPNRWLGGEFRYTYRDSPLKLSANGTDVKFSGASHIIAYDLLIHRPQRHANSRVQPFLAIGGGMRVYRGTGDEAAFQPLSDFALLTKTQDVRP